MQSHNMMQSEVLDKIGTFLDQCFEMFTDNKLTRQDVMEFISHLGPQQQSIARMLSVVNTDLIIRSFFDTHLTDEDIQFLKKCTFIIRDANGVYNYQHSNPHSPKRTRYEIKVNFLGLFLLSYYGVTFRVMTQPMRDKNGNITKIGFWHEAMNKYLDQNIPEEDQRTHHIQILPPKRSDLSSVLEDLASLNKKTYAFNPAREFHFHTGQTLPPHLLQYKFQKSISAAFQNLQMSVYRSLDEFTTTITESIIKEEKNHKPDRSLTENYIKTKVPEKLKKMFTVSSDTVTIKPLNNYYVSTIYYNLFYCLYLIHISITRNNMVSSGAQDRGLYVNTELENAKISQTNQNFGTNYPPNEQGFALTQSALSPWLCSTVAVPFDDLTPQEKITFIVTSLEKITQIIKAHGIPQSKLHIIPLTIPTLIFNAMIADTNIVNLIGDLMNQADAIVAKSEKFFALMSLPTQDLLARLLASPDAETCFFIRKILLQGDGIKKLDSEFSASTHPLFTIRPYTMVAPSLGIELYEKLWTHHSGIVAIVPPGGIAMVGYKKPAYSHNLISDKTQVISFPHNTESLCRAQGGKSKPGIAPFYTCLKTIDLKHKGLFPDKNRKSFLRDFILEYCANRPEAQAAFNQPFKFDLLERQVLLSQIPLEELEGNYGTHFSIYMNFKMKFHHRLDSFLSAHPDIKQYYAELLDTLISDEIRLQETNASKAREDAEKKRMDAITQKMAEEKAAEAKAVAAQAAKVKTPSKKDIAAEKRAAKLAARAIASSSSSVQSSSSPAPQSSPIATVPPSAPSMQDIPVTEMQIQAKHTIHDCCELTPLNTLLTRRIQAAITRKATNMVRNSYYKNLNTIPSEFKMLLATSDKQYRNMPTEYVKSSNEALIQGIDICRKEEKMAQIPFNPIKACLEVYTSSFKKYSIEEFILQLLFSRHKFVPAIYLHHDCDIGHKAAYVIHQYMKTNFKLDLNFVEYRAKEKPACKVYSANEKEAFLKRAEALINADKAKNTLPFGKVDAPAPPTAPAVTQPNMNTAPTWPQPPMNMAPGPSPFVNNISGSVGIPTIAPVSHTSIPNMAPRQAGSIRNNIPPPIVIPPPVAPVAHTSMSNMAPPQNSLLFSPTALSLSPSQFFHFPPSPLPLLPSTLQSAFPGTSGLSPSLHPTTGPVLNLSFLSPGGSAFGFNSFSLFNANTSSVPIPQVTTQSSSSSSAPVPTVVSSSSSSSSSSAAKHPLALPTSKAGDSSKKQRTISPPPKPPSPPRL